jgi:hypothetical protein
MYAQLMLFEGPQSPEVLAAAERADNERIRPLLEAHPQISRDVVAQYDLRQPDGGRALLMVTGAEATLDAVAELVMTSELLPGEDPALLPGPSRVERYVVGHSLTADSAGVR